MTRRPATRLLVAVGVAFVLAALLAVVFLPGASRKLGQLILLITIPLALLVFTAHIRRPQHATGPAAVGSGPARERDAGADPANRAWFAAAIIVGSFLVAVFVADIGAALLVALVQTICFLFLDERLFRWLRQDS